MRINRKIFIWMGFFLVLWGTYSCAFFSKDTHKITLDPIFLERMDKDVFESTQDTLENKYGMFWRVYLGPIMRFGIDSSSNISKDMEAFINHKDMRLLYDSVCRMFDNNTNLEKRVHNAFEHYKYYFPHHKTPRLVGFVSGLNYGAITVEDTFVGVGLDRFLGEGFPYYQQVFPHYMIHTMTPEHIPVDVMSKIYDHYYPSQQRGALIYDIIDLGKKMYFLECMLPNESKHLLLGYEKKEWEWCQANEFSIWQYFVDNDLLYRHRLGEKAPYIKDGPTTQGMPRQSPGRIGAWLGWQIVRSYMSEQTDSKDLSKLLETSPKTIFKRARYKPVPLS